MVRLVNFLTQPLERQLETLTWRNSPNVACWFQIKHIDLDVHKKWLMALNDPEPRTIAFFIEFEKRFVGVTYFHSIDYVLKYTDFGIYIYNMELRGKGLGRDALIKSLKYASVVMNMRKIFLEVLINNTAAARIYEKLGFVEIGRNDNIIRMEIKLDN